MKNKNNHNHIVAYKKGKKILEMPCISYSIDKIGITLLIFESEFNLGLNERGQVIGFTHRYGFITMANLISVMPT